MTVKELLDKQKSNTPFKVIGGEADEYFCYEHDASQYQRDCAIWLHGNREVKHFYFEPPCMLVIEVADGISTVIYTKNGRYGEYPKEEK